MCDSNVINELLLRITDYSKTLFGDKLKNVILYGSYARGDFDEESDIDVMVMVDLSPEELAKYRRKMSCFSSDLDLEYDVLVSIKLQSLELFEKWKKVLPYYKNVIKDGIAYDNEYDFSGASKNPYTEKQSAKNNDHKEGTLVPEISRFYGIVIITSAIIYP